MSHLFKAVAEAGDQLSPSWVKRDPDLAILRAQDGADWKRLLERMEAQAHALKDSSNPPASEADAPHSLPAKATATATITNSPTAETAAATEPSHLPEPAPRIVAPARPWPKPLARALGWSVFAALSGAGGIVALALSADVAWPIVLLVLLLLGLWRTWRAAREASWQRTSRVRHAGAWRTADGSRSVKS
jgi:hypothetical protein